MIFRTLTGIGLVLSLAACAEFDGARLVRYTDTQFYLRHNALLISDDSAKDMATAECQKDGKTARQDEAYEVYPFDIRYVTFTCVDPDVVS